MVIISLLACTHLFYYAFYQNERYKGVTKSRRQVRTVSRFITILLRSYCFLTGFQVIFNYEYLFGNDIALGQKEHAYIIAACADLGVQAPAGPANVFFQ